MIKQRTLKTSVWMVRCLSSASPHLDGLVLMSLYLCQVSGILVPDNPAKSPSLWAAAPVPDEHRGIPAIFWRQGG